MDPKTIKKGMKVNYHRKIGGPVTQNDCTVTHEPRLQKGYENLWVCMIDKVMGIVSCDALSPVEGKNKKNS